VRSLGEGKECVRLHGTRKQKTLKHVAALLHEEIRLGSRFDAFGDCLQLQALGKPDRRSNDRRCRLAGRDLRDKGAVYLQRIQLESLEVTERRIPCAEIVECD